MKLVEDEDRLSFSDGWTKNVVLGAGKKGGVIFYVHDGKGDGTVEITDAEHLENIAKWLLNRVSKMKAGE